MDDWQTDKLAQEGCAELIGAASKEMPDSDIWWRKQAGHQSTSRGMWRAKGQDRPCPAQPQREAFSYLWSNMFESRVEEVAELEREQTHN
jgi:hypothetical protein